MPLVILYGSDGGVLRAINIDSSGHLQVDALSLPSGLATETSLQKLVNALATVATDRLRASIVDALPAGSANIGDVDVASSALPTGAATAANQATEITALQLIDDLRNALVSVATDTLRANIIAALPAGSANIGDVDVASSALPTGAATAANQATEITALQLIDDLRNALATVAADALRNHPIAVNLTSGVLTDVVNDDKQVKASAGNVYWLLCKGGSDVAEISLRDGGSGGITKFVLKSPSGDSRYALFQPAIRCGTDIYVLVISGTSMEYAIGYI